MGEFVICQTHRHVGYGLCPYCENHRSAVALAGQRQRERDAAMAKDDTE